MIKHVEKPEDYDAAVQEGTVLVDFWAGWCGPCRMLTPVLEELDDAHSDKFQIVKVNVDEQGELAARFNVRSIPTMLLYKDGKIVGTKMGYMAKGPLEAWVLNSK